MLSFEGTFEPPLYGYSGNTIFSPVSTPCYNEKNLSVFVSIYLFSKVQTLTFATPI